MYLIQKIFNITDGLHKYKSFTEKTHLSFVEPRGSPELSLRNADLRETTW